MRKKIFHGYQQLKDGHSPIEHWCSKINEGLKCNTLIYKYTGNPNTEKKSFRNRTKLWEIEIEENQRKRKRYTLSPRRKKE